MILKIDRLAIAFGPKRVLQGVSFSVSEGETVAVMGPNGAGKTTILRCILGLLQYQGAIEVAGQDARAVKARAKIAYVPQVPAFYDMTAREMMLFIAKLRGVGGVEAALERMGLAKDADRPIRVFSGGMQQGLSLAAALLGDPPLVLLDEPTANLDPSARAELLGLLNEFRAAGKTLVISSHRAREVRGLVDRVILLQDGVIVRQGAPEDVLPADRVSLSVVAHASGDKERLATLLGVAMLPSLNGTYNATLPAQEIVAVVEKLRGAGVPAADIALRPVDEGGLA